jgi:hypothetical protein
MWTDACVARHQLHITFDARQVLGKLRPTVSVSVRLVRLLPLSLRLPFFVALVLARRVVGGRLRCCAHHERQLELQAMHPLARRAFAILPRQLLRQILIQVAHPRQQRDDRRNQHR